MKAVNFGIDLGTTNSLIARFENGNVMLFKNPIGHKESLASVVAFRKDRVLIGDKAREYLLKDPVNVFGSFKRRMGTDYKFYVVNIDENMTPVELSAMVLKELKRFIHTGEEPEAVVITIPASFDTMQATATKEAGLKAGFQEVFLLQEPIAASLAYFNHINRKDEDGLWLVYDLGGGTFDIALIETKEGEMKVKDHVGNNFLGGVDFDSLIIEKLFVPKMSGELSIDNFYEQLTERYGKYEKIYYYLLYLAEEVKKELSIQTESEVDFSVEIDGEAYDFYITITRDEFNGIISGKVDETITMIQTIMERNHLQSHHVNEIILVGGSTFIPYVRMRLYEKTGVKVNSGVDPTSAVAIGAAYYAANKYYTPEKKSVPHKDFALIPGIRAYDDSPEGSGAPEEAPDLKVTVVYNKMSRDPEEVVLIRVEGEYENYTYRITREDGGFDTGIMKMRSKFTEFLSLLPGITNRFRLHIFNKAGKEVQSEDIAITHGQYSIAGQPLPKDICIEVDDKENNTTKLEVIFERNSILPLKKTLYREISKTIKQNSGDSIIISILEGDKFARSISNLPIGFIEISGKDLSSDLIKGSDIEIRISVSDDRVLSVEVFLVMTQQEFKNVFSISEKHINISRLKEQFTDLESDIRTSLKEFSMEDESVWTIQTQNLLNGLLEYKTDLFRMKENDHTDKRYIIAETVSRISQEFDKIGGNDRMEQLISEYFKRKEQVREIIHSVNMDKEKTMEKFSRIISNENQILTSRNPAIVKRTTDYLDNLYWDALWHTDSHVVSLFYHYRNMDSGNYKSYHSAKNLFQMGEKAIHDGRYMELRQVVNSLVNITYLNDPDLSGDKKNFKGTGIG
ncbi:MAG TPA: hypothetical protein DEQ30_06585 [Porphyromonadaceae bacterium]|nr:hypothetical protein [Porphyromonadaceae bacterium]